MNELFNRKNLFAFGIILFAITSRIIPHAYNFAPFGAIALFCAAHIENKKVGFIIPLIAAWISGMIINNVFYTEYYPNFTLLDKDIPWQVLSYGLIFLLGTKVLSSKITVSRILGSAIGSSLVFFIITNFGVWASWSTYPKNLAGLAACYTAAIPFYQSTLIGDVLYSGVLFGAFAYFTSKNLILESVK
jgi:hypothetical protein